MKQNQIKEKSFAFAVRAFKLYKYLAENKKEHLLSKQFARSGTSIGANVSEALRAQTKPDFIAKMSIALKEANETEYWLRLLYATEYLTKSEFDSMYRDIDELISLLVAICKTSQQNQKQNAKT
ncbi:MAG: four helix bundle protein [Clostridia bacterium]|nr:four helix bundle protein [Clostridia bacterium]